MLGDRTPLAVSCYWSEPPWNFFCIIPWRRHVVFPTQIIFCSKSHTNFHMCPVGDIWGGWIWLHDLWRNSCVGWYQVQVRSSCMGGRQVSIRKTGVDGHQLPVRNTGAGGHQVLVRESSVGEHQASVKITVWTPSHGKTYWYGRTPSLSKK